MVQTTIENYDNPPEPEIEEADSDESSTDSVRVADPVTPDEIRYAVRENDGVLCVPCCNERCGQNAEIDISPVDPGCDDDVEETVSAVREYDADCYRCAVTDAIEEYRE